MRAQSALRVGAILLVAFNLQLASAGPAAAASWLQARACCKKHCAHARTPASAPRCCSIETDRSVPATLSSRPASPADPAPLLASYSAHQPILPADVATHSVAAPSDRTRGRPVYLLTASLRL